MIDEVRYLTEKHLQTDVEEPNISNLISNNDVIIICYGEQSVMNRADAISFFRDGMVACGGSSEGERYANIYYDLIQGKKVCKDI